MVTESEILKSIKNNLSLYCPEVVCVIRIFTGVAKSQFSQAWIHGAEPGTADLCVILNSDGGHTIFFEIKRPKGGRKNDDQKRFMFKIMGLRNVHYAVVTSLFSAVTFINGITNRTTGDCLK